MIVVLNRGLAWGNLVLHSSVKCKNINGSNIIVNFSFVLIFLNTKGLISPSFVYLTYVGFCGEINKFLL